METEFIEVTFKDQYLGRKDMWRLKKSLIGKSVYVKQVISCLQCMKIQIKTIYRNKAVFSGFITQNTRITFRSESARIYIFIQMSKEMYDYDNDDGYLYHEKLTLGLLPDLFTKWKNSGVNHMVTFILTTRIFYDKSDEVEELMEFSTSAQIDYFISGSKQYKDYYKVIYYQEIKSDWKQSLSNIKNEILNFEKNTLRIFNKRLNNYQIIGQKSLSIHGNILESLNLALNNFDYHYVDRDLIRTGLCINFITPGTGVFNVPKKLLKIINERMNNNGISLDLICLSPPPLHLAPLFKFYASLPNETKNSIEEKRNMSFDSCFTNSINENEAILALFNSDTQVVESEELYYFKPFWIESSYYIYNDLEKCTEIKPKFNTSFIFEEFYTSPMNAIQIPKDEMNFNKLCVNGEFSEDLFINYSKEHDISVFKSNKNTTDRNTRQFEKKHIVAFQPFSKKEPSHKITLSNITGKTSKSFNFDFTTPSLVKAKTHSILPNQNKKIDIKNYLKIDRSKEKGINRNLSSTNLSATSSVISSNNSFKSKYSLLNFKNLSFKSNKLFKDNLNKELFNVLTSYEHYMENRKFPQGKWSHVYSPRIKKDGMKWDSLITPACLPLTSDDFLTELCSSKNFNEYVYTVSFYEKRQYKKISKNLDPGESLLEEIISHRLGQGFQVFESFDSKILQKYESFVKKSVNLRDNSKLLENVFLLGYGNQVHKLSILKSSQCIEIKRYVKETKFVQTSYNYLCSIWYRTAERYHNRNFKFLCSNLDLYNWNYLDQLISGYKLEVKDESRFWKARFLILPCEHSPLFYNINQNDEFNTEENKIAGFIKFVEQFQKNRIDFDNELDLNSKSKFETINNLNIYFTTLTPSNFVKSDMSLLYKNSNNISYIRDNDFNFSDKLFKSSKLSSIAMAMLDSEKGLKFSNRRWHLFMFKNVFVGNQFTDWILKWIDGINTREEAIEYGNMLMEKGLFEHCNKKHAFLDGHYFYQLKSKYKALKNSNNSWFKPKNFKSISSDLIKVVDSKKKIEKISLSQKITINIDYLNKSDKEEIAILHYDTLYNFKMAYHFQIHWLNCTSRLIDELLKNWSRTAEKHGLFLTEAPLLQTDYLDEKMPFYAPEIIKLAQPPPNIYDSTRNLLPELRSAIPGEYFMKELTKKFEFVLDIEAIHKFPNLDSSYSYQNQCYKRTQYIHKYGVLILQLMNPEEGNGFLLEVNKLFNFESTHFRKFLFSKISDSKKQLQEIYLDYMKDIKSEIKSFCEDKNKLTEFWSKCLKKAHTRDGLEEIFDEVPDSIIEALNQQFPIKSEVASSYSQTSTSFSQMSSPKTHPVGHIKNNSKSTNSSSNRNNKSNSISTTGSNILPKNK